MIFTPFLFLFYGDTQKIGVFVLEPIQIEFSKIFEQRPY